MIKLSSNEAYKSWRNKARPYSLISILNKAIAALHSHSSDKVEELRKAPWLTLLLLKWVCQDKMIAISRGQQISDTNFDDLRQRLWDFPESIDHGITTERPAQLFMRQLLRPQIDFQRRLTLGFLREAALLAQQPKNSRLRNTFESKTGLPVEAFVDLSFAVHAAVLEGKLIVKNSWFGPLRKAYDGQVDAFINLVSRDIRELIDFFRKLPDANEKHASELFEFPTIKRFPFLREDAALVCWHPMVFYRGMEGIVHSVMSEVGAAYIQDFSKLFERHVIAEAEQMPGGVFYSEANIQRWIPAGCKVSDGLISFPGSNIFIESKAGMFDESVMVAGHSQIFRTQTQLLRSAMRQAWSCSDGLRARGEAPAGVLNAEKDYLLVVTNKELSAGRGDRLAAMYPEGIPEGEGRVRLPMDHIYFLSIEDFERLVHGIGIVGMTLPEFLENCIHQDRDPMTSVFYFQQHLDNARFPRNLSSLIHDAAHDAEQRIRAALQENS